MVASVETYPARLLFRPYSRLTSSIRVAQGLLVDGSEESAGYESVYGWPLVIGEVQAVNISVNEDYHCSRTKGNITRRR